MPSIWITSNPRSESSRAIHSVSRAADSATKRREAADFDRPEPLGAGTSPSGKRTERLNLRVETLISIWFMAHLPSQSSVIAPSQLGRACSLPSKPRRRGAGSTQLGRSDDGRLAWQMGHEPDADQRLDAQVQTFGSLARGRSAGTQRFWPIEIGRLPAFCRAVGGATDGMDGA